MPTITVRDVPAFVHERLKRRAEAHNRSLSGEVIELLEQAVLGPPPARRLAESILDDLKREQKRTPAWDASAEEIKRAMREGLA